MNKPVPGKIKIEFLWPTNLSIKNIDTEKFSSIKSSLISYTKDHSLLTSFANGLEVLESQILGELKDLSSNYRDHVRIENIKGEKKSWKQGDHISFCSCKSKFLGLLWIVVHDSSTIPGGEIIIQDPRAGAANISFPGLPFGRPVVINPKEGMLLILPGWLGYSLSPLGSRAFQDVWHLEID